VNRRAVNLATSPVLAAIKGTVPVDKGNLKAALKKKITSRKMRATGLVGADASYVGPNGEQPFRYDHLVEFGHVDPDGTVVPPNPYMRAGWDAAEATARETYQAELADGIETEAKKLAGGG
jgi:hypothetical protein